MSNQTTVITLFSSDSTVQYIKDIFSVLSLPRGSGFQFRYQSNYVDPRVVTLFSNNTKNLNLKALVAFRSNHSTPNDKCFFIPIRWVRVQSVVHISNGYTVNFEIDGYPSYLPNFRTASATFQGINTSAQNFFQTMGNNDYAVWGEPLPIVNFDDNIDRDSENWFEIVKSLTLIPDYKDYHFFKCSAPYTEEINNINGQYEKEECEKNGHLITFVEGKCVNIDVEYYSESYDRSKKRQINVLVDNNIIGKAKGLHSILQSRYGTIRLGLQPKKVANNTITEVIITSSSSVVNELETEIVFPIIVVKNKFHKLIKAFITAAGALLVALPGIIGDNLDIGWNILIAGIGVFVLGINNYWESKE